MKKYNQWVMISTFDKIPYQTNGLKASISDPTTWSSFDECITELRVCEDWIYIAFAFTEHDPFCFVDIDGIGTEKCKVTKENLIETVHLFETYAEVSRSGSGVHIVGYGKMEEAWWNKNEPIGFEMYSKNHFMTFTGIYLEPVYPLSCIDSQMSAIQLKYAKKWIKRECGVNEMPISQIYAKIQRGYWLILCDGDSPSGDESGADFSLMCKIGELSNFDLNVMEEVFSMTRRGKREKWVTRKDYRERTLNSVLRKRG